MQAEDASLPPYAPLLPVPPEYQDFAESPEMTAETPLDWAGLLALVNDELATEIQSDKVNVACAGEVLADKTGLLAEDGDEVAILPPVSGG